MSGLKTNAMIFSLFKGCAGMELAGHRTSFSLNMTFIVKTRKSTWPTRSLIPIAICCSLSRKLSRILLLKYHRFARASVDWTSHLSRLPTNHHTESQISSSQHESIRDSQTPPSCCKVSSDLCFKAQPSVISLSPSAIFT
jgi:hypothetical protein